MATAPPFNQIQGDPLLSQEVFRFNKFFIIFFRKSYPALQVAVALA
jgi:hypothetical protein